MEREPSTNWAVANMDPRVKPVGDNRESRLRTVTNENFTAVAGLDPAIHLDGCWMFPAAADISRYCIMPWPDFGDGLTGYLSGFARRDLTAAGCNTQLRQDMVAQPQEGGIRAIAICEQVHRLDAGDAAGMRLHDDDAIAEIDRFIDIMGHENGGDPLMPHHALQLVLPTQAGGGGPRPPAVVAPEEARPAGPGAGQGETPR